MLFGEYLMRKSFGRSAVFLAASVALVLTSCAESKVAQCNKIIGIANQAAETSQEFGKNPQPEKGGKAFIEVADKLDALATSMAALEISDEKLKGFQASYVEMYKVASKGLRGGAVALDKKDVAAMQKEMKVIQDGTSQEGKLVNDTNTYCSAS
jgi:hypothetical protein